VQILARDKIYNWERWGGGGGAFVQIDKKKTQMERDQKGFQLWQNYSVMFFLLRIGRGAIKIINLELDRLK
jgi:hypothetical protein